MLLRECHSLCWKTCAVYSTIPLDRPNRYKLFEFISSRWYRGDETRLCWDSFFGKLIDCWSHTDAPKTMPKIIESHRRLCDQVQQRQVVLDLQDTHDHNRQHPLVRNVSTNCYTVHSQYHLLPSFYSIFLLIDRLDYVELTEFGETWSHWDREDGHLVFTGDPRGMQVDLEALCTRNSFSWTGNILHGRFRILVDIVITLDEKNNPTHPTISLSKDA